MGQVSGNLEGVWQAASRNGNAAGCRMGGQPDQLMRLLIVAILVVVGAALMPPTVTLYEDGSYTFLSSTGCLPTAICNEGE